MDTKSHKELSLLVLSLMGNVNLHKHWEEIVEYARANEVIIPVLRYLKKLNDSGEKLNSEHQFISLFNKEMQQYNLFWRNVHEIHQILSKEEIDHIFIKTIRVYECYDWDINILIDQRDWPKALKVFYDCGWRRASIFSHPVAQIELGKLLLERKDSFPIHLHKTVSWNGLEYVPSWLVLSSRSEVNGIPYPSKLVDALIYCAQSLFENYKLTLGEIYHLMHVFENVPEEDYISLARQNGWSKGAKLVIDTAKKIWNFLKDEKKIELPYRYKFKSLLRVWNEHAWKKGFGPYEMVMNSAMYFLKL